MQFQDWGPMLKDSYLLIFGTVTSQLADTEQISVAKLIPLRRFPLPAPFSAFLRLGLPHPLRPASPTSSPTSTSPYTPTSTALTDPDTEINCIYG